MTKDKKMKIPMRDFNIMMSGHHYTILLFPIALTLVIDHSTCMVGTGKYAFVLCVFWCSLLFSAHVPHQVLAVAPGALPEANASTRSRLQSLCSVQADVSSAVQKKEEGAASSGGWTRADASLQRPFNAMLNSQIHIIWVLKISFSILIGEVGGICMNPPFLGSHIWSRLRLTPGQEDMAGG